MPTPVPQTPQTPPAVPDATAQQLTDVVTRLRRALRTSIRTEYPWEALPMAQIELMQALSDRSPARVGDLAARQRLSTSTVSGLIDRSVQRGLVRKSADAADGRAVRVSLTAQARRQIGRAHV